MAESSTLLKDKIAGSLYGLLVGDALAVPSHWFYSPTKLREDYGEITTMVAPKLHHAESFFQATSYDGTIDILHDKAAFYAAKELAKNAKKDSEIMKILETEGGGDGESPKRLHYHATLKKGQNTANVCISRLLMRYLASVNKDNADLYDPDEFLTKFYDYMTTKPDPNDDSQLVNHNDTYLDIYVRDFFTSASKGLPLRLCAAHQRDDWSIGSIDAVVMAIPIIAAYAHEPDGFVTARAIEHHMLTHRSVAVTATVAVLVPLLLKLYRGADLRTAIDETTRSMRPPKITGRALMDSYRQHRGPGNIPKQEKWLQHMQVSHTESTYELIHSMLEWDDEDAAGAMDRENSRLSTACYCEHTFTVALYLAYKYADNPAKALLQNGMIGGHTTSRGAILGTLLGAAHGTSDFPFVEELCAKEAIDKEIAGIVSLL